MTKVTITRISDTAGENAVVEFTGEGCSGYVSAPWDDVNHLEPGGEYPISFGERVPAENATAPNGDKSPEGSNASSDTGIQNTGAAAADPNGKTPEGAGSTETSDPNGSEVSGGVSETGGADSSAASTTGDPGDEQQH
jgi:hypothetical protein